MSDTSIQPLTIQQIRLAVFQAAELSDPPTWAMFRQAQIECGWDLDVINGAVVSSAGARGPFQIEPATAAGPGYGVPAISPEDALDPTLSTLWAGKYLTALRNGPASGRWGVAFLMYNVGPGASVSTASDAYRQLAQYVALTLGEADPVLVG